MTGIQNSPVVRRAVMVACVLSGFAAWGGAAEATGWYVDGASGARYNSGTQSSPYLYLWQALQKVQPGDTIYVVPSMTYPMLGFTAKGTASASINLVGSDPSHPTKVSGGGSNTGIWINGNYLSVQNFDVTAPGANVGIGTAPWAHHVLIANNVVHGAGNNGINTFANDYLTISHNVVYGNARNTTEAFGSGISILGSVDIDSNRGVKMVIDGNVVYSNTNTPNCTTAACFASANDSDGSGIILDDNHRERFDNIPYKGAFLVSNNIIYRNGGRGVHVYKSGNATITGNTMWSNNQDPYEAMWHPGEVSVVQGGNVGVYNNILLSDGLSSPIHSGSAPNTHVTVSFENCADGTGPLTAKYNLGYNPQNDSKLSSYVQNNTNPVVIGSNLFSGPKLENPTYGDFRFRPGSPAYHAGNAATSMSSDILGALRAPTPSIGAYQNAGP